MPPDDAYAYFGVRRVVASTRSNRFLFSLRGATIVDDAPCRVSAPMLLFDDGTGVIVSISNL